MNGSKKFIIGLLFLVVSCVRQSKENSENAESILYFTYKGIKPVTNKTLEIWDFPQQFLQRNADYITNFAQENFFLQMDNRYIILRMGEKISQGPSYVSNISYYDDNSKLIIFLDTPNNENLKNTDTGYLLFIRNKAIRTILFHKNNRLIFQTNINVIISPVP